MERDIIIEALHRFRDIVDHPRSSAAATNRLLESDRRLARLAIKKYNLTMEWRSRRGHHCMAAEDHPT